MVDRPYACEYSPIAIGADETTPIPAGPITIQRNVLHSGSNHAILVTGSTVASADIQANTVHVTPWPSCESIGARVENVAVGAVAGNALLGANPISVINNSTVTVCSSQLSGGGGYTEPDRCCSSLAIDSSNDCASLWLDGFVGTSTDTAASGTVYGLVKAAESELASWPNPQGGYHATCAASISNARSRLDALQTQFGAYPLSNASVSFNTSTALGDVIDDLTHACGAYAGIDAFYHPADAAHQQATAAFVRRAAEVANQRAYKADTCYMRAGAVPVVDPASFMIPPLSLTPSATCSALTIDAVVGASTDGKGENTLTGLLTAASIELASWPTQTGYRQICGDSVTHALGELASLRSGFSGYALANASVAFNVDIALGTVIQHLTHACAPYTALDAANHPSNAEHQQRTLAYLRRAAELANQLAFKSERCYLATGAVPLVGSYSFGCVPTP